MVFEVAEFVLTGKLNVNLTCIWTKECWYE